MDWVKAGFDMEMRDRITGDIFTIYMILEDDLCTLVNHRTDTIIRNKVDCFVNDEVITVKPRPLTSLPNGTKVEFEMAGKTYYGKILNADKVSYAIEIDGGSVWTMRFNEVIPILEKQKKEKSWQENLNNFCKGLRENGISMKDIEKNFKNFKNFK